MNKRNRIERYERWGYIRNHLYPEKNQSINLSKGPCNYEQWFFKIIEKASIAVGFFQKGITIYVNQAYASLFGYQNVEELIGCSILDQVVVQCREEIHKNIQDQIQGSLDDLSMETTGIRKDGHQFPFYLKLNHTELSGELITIGYFFDITNMKNVVGRLEINQQELNQIGKPPRESENYYLFLAENSTDVIFVLDKSFRCTYISPTILRLRGLTPEEVIQEPFEKSMTPSSILTIHNAFDEVKKEILSGKSDIVKRFEIEQYHKDGSLVWVEVIAKYFSDDKKVYPRWICISRDISEQKLLADALRVSEERYWKIFLHNPAAISIIDVDNNYMFIDVNEAFCKVSGYQRSEVIGRTVDDLNLFVTTAEQESLAKQINNLQCIRNIEYKFYKKNGEIGIGLICIEFLNVHKRSLVITSTVDITEKKTSRIKLENTIQQLHTLSNHLQTIREEERTFIAREIHDELGQSLTGLSMELYWIKDLVSKEYSPGFTRLIDEKLGTTIREVDRIIDSLRKICTHLRPSILDTFGLIPALEWLAQDFETHYRIKCIFLTNMDNILFDIAFSTAIFRICQEALINIIRHAHASEIRISLNKKQKNIILEIQDNGIGMSLSAINNINSLGLLGMKERAYAFQGTIDFKKDRKGGTKVIAHFPLIHSNKSING